MDAESLKRAFTTIGADLSFLRELRKEAVVAVLLVALGFVFHRSVYTENVRRMNSLESEAASLRQEIVRIRSEISASERLRREVEEASKGLALSERRLRTIRERLPSETLVSAILDEITGADFRRGVNIVSIKPLPPEAKGELTRLPFQLTLEARFIPFGEYVERIENMPRIMIIDNFLIESKDDTSAVLNANVYISAYVLGRK